MHVYALLVIGLISCSMLMYEILFTRICALRLFFHFGYLVVSNCLLGIGASGSLIAIFQERLLRRPRFWIWTFSGLYVASVAATYAFLVTFEIPPQLDFARSEHLARFFVFTLVGTVPLFFGGAVVGMILTTYASRVNAMYASDLTGAGLGCLVVPLALSQVGAGGVVVVIALLGLAGVMGAAPAGRRGATLAVGAPVLLAGLWLLPNLERMVPVPGKEYVGLTDQVDVYVGGRIIDSSWSTSSRIDVTTEGGPSYLPTLGARWQEEPLPERHFIVQDGSAGTFIMNFSDEPERLPLLRGSLYSASYRLRPGAQVFVIGAGGGNDLWAARLHDARRVRAIELNEPVIRVHSHVLERFSRDLISDPRIEFVHGEGRSVLMRDPDRYDVIQMTGIDTWTALASGAYVLAENYLYTVEAVTSMLEHLAPDGVLQIVRFSRDAEAMRLAANIHGAFQGLGIEGFERSLIALQTQDLLMATLVKPGGFTSEEVASTEAFALENGIEIRYLPGRDTGSFLEKFVRADDKAAFTRSVPSDISPTTDDRPYFFSFWKWRDPWKAAEGLNVPTEVAQGNPAFILGQLAVSATLAGALILLPLGVFARRGTDRTHAGRYLLYFSGLGMGFIAIEIALMQKLTLFLGHPIYSISVTLFSVLIFAGLGALVSGSWLREPSQRWWIPLGLALLIGLIVQGSPALVREWIGAPLAVRVALSVAILAPVSLLLGVPFAYGIRVLEGSNPTFIPWAWAINGCTTVVGSILTVVVSMNVGFSWVLVGAVLVYFAAFAALPAASGRGSGMPGGSPAGSKADAPSR